MQIDADEFSGARWTINVYRDMAAQSLRPVTKVMQYWERDCSSESDLSGPVSSLAVCTPQCSHATRTCQCYFSGGAPRAAGAGRVQGSQGSAAVSHAGCYADLEHRSRAARTFGALGLGEADGPSATPRPRRAPPPAAKGGMIAGSPRLFWVRPCDARALLEHLPLGAGGSAQSPVGNTSHPGPPGS